MAYEDETKSIRIKVGHDRLVTRIAEAERRGKGVQLEVLIEEGARATGHSDLVDELLAGR